MTIPDIAHVRARIGSAVLLHQPRHWISGRIGLTYLVTAPQTGEQSVFKWCSSDELACIRDMLPAAPIATPHLYRWWDAEGELPAAVELEFIPHLALPMSCYRFAPEYLPLMQPMWRGDLLNQLMVQLGQMHAYYVDGKHLERHRSLLTCSSSTRDLQLWETDMRKLADIAHLPGAGGWIAFWSARESYYQRLLEELYHYPVTWIWGDAKWDHVGCRADETLVLLEWSTMAGPAGSDLYLALFEDSARRAELLTLYLQHAQGMLETETELRHYLRLGVERACHIHGPGQACLSLRGCAGSESTAEDKAAWQTDAIMSARAAEALASSEAEFIAV